jgi:hypothetical protein
MTQKQREERAKMVLSMEYICRQINDESVLLNWLMGGVADEDIPYGSFDPSLEVLDEYIEDENTFRDLMDCFLRRMVAAKRSGGLWCGDVRSSSDEQEEE